MVKSEQEIKKGDLKSPFLIVLKAKFYLPIRFTAARDFLRISPLRGTNPREGALAWALSLSK